jgi:3-deoxy-D-manno-octulosonic-acid transferase/tetraacyldisaccharide-1-P 4'-kinase
LRDKRYFRGLDERFGVLPASFQATAPGAIWLHAVSVGEVVSAAGLVRALREAVPGERIYVSCTTLAGREVAEKRLGGVADGIFYAPVDYCWAVRPVLRRLRPRLVIVLETEIWPNLYNEAKRCGAGLMIANGRISDRALPRYRRFRWFFSTVLALPDRILVQSETDRSRYIDAGAPPGRVSVAGNLKYDFDPTKAAVAPELHAWASGGNSLWVAASTMPPALPGDPDEDDAVLDAWEALRERPGLRLALVPRKPERFDLAAQKLEARGIRYARRSTLGGETSAPVLLLDTVGELGGLFRYASAVFMGGTIASRGGHNVLEPAAFGKPVIVGPHMENFREIAAEFSRASAVVEIARAEELGAAVAMLLDKEAQRVEIGQRARALAESERGATARVVAVARELHSAAVPHVLPYGPLHPLLWLLSRLWILGVWLERWRTQPRRLSTPVVSVGGIAVGGTGKTPLVRWLAKELTRRGMRVAILTRGYRRADARPLSVLPGEVAPLERTGDEAQLYVLDGHAAVGIGSDRHASGLALENSWHPDLFLLDDGFQHWDLARDLDIVVLDDLDPHGGGEVLPLGRLREPVSALRRANFVLTKQLRPVRWVPKPMPEGRLGAFCGTGNPASFWRTLDNLGIATVRRWTFPDHHRYSPAELQSMLDAGCDALLTTEKDFQNTPPGYPIHWLEAEFDGPPELVDRIAAIARKPVERH